MRDKVLTEKYRPTEWEGFISNDKDKLKKMLETPFSMPHLLLVSTTPGTGKTTLGKLIIKQLKADFLIINSSNDRKIDIIRSKVSDFASTGSTNPDVPKIVLLDEVDGMLKLTQEALRNLMETYSGHCKFILTANNFNKIHSAIVSRCVQIDFKAPDRVQIWNHLKDICTKENISHDADGINKLSKMHYPSIRNMINHLQDLQISELSVTEENIKKIDEQFARLWNDINAEKFDDVRKYILENNVKCRELNTYIWNEVILEKLSTKTAAVLQQLAENEYRFSVGAEHSLIFVTSLIKIIGLWRAV